MCLAWWSVRIATLFHSHTVKEKSQGRTASMRIWEPISKNRRIMKCKKCGRELPYHDFRVNSNCSLVRVHVCKECEATKRLRTIVSKMSIKQEVSYGI